MNDEDPLRDKIYEWVEKSGRALELRTARAFWDGTATTVAQSYVFTDPTNKSTPREGDVLASFDWITKARTDEDGLACSLRVVVECKSSTAKPWVAFEPTDTVARGLGLDDWLIRAWAPWSPIHDVIEKAWNGHAPYEDASAASHVIAANLGNGAVQNNDDKSKNFAGDAIQQVLAAANAVAENDVQNGQPRGIYVLAAVVTAAPLYTCRLDSEGHIHLNETDHFTVYSHHSNHAQRVHVLNEKKLPAFVEKLGNLAKRANNN